MAQSDRVSLLRLGYKKTVAFIYFLSLSFSLPPSLSLPLWFAFLIHSLWGETCPEQHYGEVHVARNWSLLPTVLWDMICSSNQIFTGCSPDSLIATSGETRGRTTQLSHSQLPGPRKLSEITDICCFKDVHFGVICYITTDNTLRMLSNDRHPSGLESTGPSHLRKIATQLEDPYKWSWSLQTEKWFSLT